MLPTVKHFNLIIDIVQKHEICYLDLIYMTIAKWKIAKIVFVEKISHYNNSVAGMLAEWIDDSFTLLKVMWYEVADLGALTTYKVTYVPVGNTAGIMNISSSGELTATAMNNSIVLTGLDPSKLYSLHVEVLVLPATINSIQVALGKCMCAYLYMWYIIIQVHLAAIPVNHNISGK